MNKEYLYKKFIKQNNEGEKRNLSYIKSIKTGEILDRYEFACKFCDIKNECKIYQNDKGSAKSYNFYGGILPLCAAKKIKKEIFNSKLSLNKIAYSLKNYDSLLEESKILINDILDLKNNYEIIFLQSSASSQFYMVPANFIKRGQIGNYIVTDNWSERALDDAKEISNIHIAASTSDRNHNYIPSKWKLSKNPAYVHITSNNTIFGTRWLKFPSFGDIPIIADMTSDIFSRPFDATNFGMIYAGSQKNLGVPGITLIIIRKDMLKRSSESSASSIIKYSNLINNNVSGYKAPPSMAIYIIKLVLDWIKQEGGLKNIDKINKKKASVIYKAIKESNGFYIGHADKKFRSLMNITFSLRDETLMKKFIKSAAKKGLNGLKGLQSKNGLRASVFNAMPQKACDKLALFMNDFKNSNM